MACLALTAISSSSGAATTVDAQGRLLFLSRKGETSDAPGHLRFGVVNGDGTGATILRDLGGDVDWAWLSPDLRSVGLTDDSDRLFVVELASGRRRQIAARVHSWDWAPDGRRIAYSSGTEEGRVRQIYVVRSDGSHRLQITRNARRTSWKYFFPYNLLRWSPDGTRIAFANWQNYSGHGPLTGGRLLTISPNGGPERQSARLATYGRGWAFVPYTLSWAPNSSALAVASQATSGVLVVRGTSSKWLRGSQCCVGPNYLAWSPDSRRIAFFGSDTSSSASGGASAVDGSFATTFVGAGDNYVTSDPTWSPAGDRLAFLECRYDDSYDSRGRCVLTMSDRRARHRTQLRTNVAIDGLLAWSR